MEKQSSGNYQNNYRGNNPRYDPSKKRPYDPNYKSKQYNQQKQQRSQKEMEEISEMFNKMKKKYEQYATQNTEITQDNKIKAKKVSELQKIISSQQIKTVKIKNSIKLSLATIENTQESKEDVDQILKANQICQNGDSENMIQDLTVYSVLYCTEGKSNIKFIIGKKRKREYWFPDCKNNGFKQLYKGGLILKQIYKNQICFPNQKINTLNEQRERNAFLSAKQTIKNQFCFDIDDYQLLEEPWVHHTKYYSTVFYKLSSDDLNKIFENQKQIFANVEKVIETEMQKENEEIDDSIEKHEENYNKLMKKYGWIYNKNTQQWEFPRGGPAPSISLDTTLDQLQLYDYERDIEQINTWKKHGSGLDWYYSIVDYLKNKIRHPQIERDL